MLRKIFNLIIFACFLGNLLGLTAARALDNIIPLNSENDLACLIGSAGNQLISTKGNGESLVLDFNTKRSELLKEQTTIGKKIKKLKSKIKKLKGRKLPPKQKRQLKKIKTLLKILLQNQKTLPELLAALDACQNGEGIFAAPKLCDPSVGEGDQCDDENICTINDLCLAGVCSGDPISNSELVQCGLGQCQRSVQSCLNGVLQTCVPGVPQTEVCNQLDDDCDGNIDNGLDTSTTCGIGACQRTVKNCENGVNNNCTPGEPSSETCNGLDDNCNGTNDESACALGQACSSNNTCVSGFCVDGICCNEACNGTCKACNLNGHVGTCESIPAGQDPANECQASAQSSCGTNGSCNGSGACQLYAAGTQCQNASCIAGQASLPDLCDGRGNCVDAGSQNCTPYICGANACLTSCADNTQCTSGFVCISGQCKKMQGSACANNNECALGFCVDGVCCNQACNGTCKRCNLVGSVGNCNDIQANTDPDNECPAVNCSNFFFGFEGDTCFNVANVSASTATCNGSGACRTPAQECLTNPVKGNATITCQADCQSPTNNTCVGGIAGTCSNINPGTQSCGTGLCTRTVNQCFNGQPLACVPGNPTAETCDNLDNDCDGTIDNNISGDGQEENNTCLNARTLTSVGSDQTRTVSNLTVYPAGDFDFFHITANETDNTCSCSFPSLDEDYQFSATITVPIGAGSYELCSNIVSCSSFTNCITVDEGQQGTLSFFLDGACGPTPESYDIFLRVRGSQSPAFECSPYTLSYNFDAGFCR